MHNSLVEVKNNKSIIERFAIWISVTFSVLIFHSKLGLGRLLPGDNHWLLTRHSDWTPDYVAWLYYKQSPWRFPIGLFDGYSFPETVSIGLTGGIPLLAIPFKIIAPLLSDDFHYFGWWMLLCFVLQAVFSFKLLKAIGVKDIYLQILGSCLFVLSYTFLDRIGHINLCAHWILLAGMYIYFSSKSWNRMVFGQSLTIIASVLIHPYLIVFAILLAGANALNMLYLKQIKLLGFVSAVVVFGLVLMATWMGLGNHVLESSKAVAEGFGLFSSNLNTFWSPHTATPLVSPMDLVFREQYEGAAYLGLGVLSFVLVLPYFWLKKQLKPVWEKQFIVFLLLAFSLAALAVTHIVTFNHHILFEVPLPQRVLDKLAILRASGRYIWLLHYFILAYYLLLVDRLEVQKWIKYAIVVFAIAINVVDFYDLIRRNDYVKTYYKPIEPFDDSQWNKIFEGSEQLRMYPSHLTAYQHKSDQMGFSYLASQYGLSINTGHLARFDADKRRAYGETLKDSIFNHPLGLTHYTFITRQKDLKEFIHLVETDNHSLIEQDGYYVFLPKSHAFLNEVKNERQITKVAVPRLESLDAFVDRHRGATFLVAVMDEGSAKLQTCSEFLSKMDSIESKIGDLKFRESYVGIFNESQLYEEKFGSTANEDGIANLATTLKFADGIEKNIELSSAGMDNGNMARIFVEGRDQSLNERGLNVVVLDRNGQVVERTVFDTFLSCQHLTENSELFYDIWTEK